MTRANSHVPLAKCLHQDDVLGLEPAWAALLSGRKDARPLIAYVRASSRTFFRREPGPDDDGLRGWRRR